MSQEKRPEKRPEGEKPRDPPAKGKANDEASSMLGRVGASVSDLIQSFSGPSAPAAVSSDLASLHASTSKGESSASSSGGSIFAPQEAHTGTRSQDNGLHSGHVETFRTTPARNTASAQEDFDTWSASSEILPDGNIKSGDTFGSSNGHSPANPGKTPVRAAVQTNGNKAYGAIVESDGAAVSFLLSEPNLDVDTVPPDTWDPLEQSQEPNFEDYWLVGRGNTERQVEVTKSALASQDHPLETNKPRKQYGLVPHSWSPMSEKIKSNMNDSQRDEIIREIDIADQQTQPWIAILDRYQDEVWGDMLPLVREAREEVKKAEENQDQLPQAPLVGPAVRRLQMVLRHMNNSGSSR